MPLIIKNCMQAICWRRPRIISLAMSLIVFSLPVQAAVTNLEQVLQAVIDNYPSVQSASLQVEKARQNLVQVESQLGWMLSGSGGIAKDVSFFGSGVKRVQAGGSLSRKLESGSSLSFSGNISYEDSEVPLSGSLPDPVTSTALDVQFRKPLEKGAENLDYELGLKNAELSVLLAQSDRQALYDQLAANVIDLYLAAIITRIRIDNIRQGIARTDTLQKFIQGRLTLGIAETKDQLQISAQLHGQQAQLEALNAVWVQQQVALNRLMGLPWDERLQLQVMAAPALPDGDINGFHDEAVAHSPSLKRVQAQMLAAEYAIKRQQEQRKDELDLVMHLGNRSSFGDSNDGNADNTEMVGGVSVEFMRLKDQRGFDAALYQARLDHSLALQEQRRLMQDIQYDLAALLAESRAIDASLKAYEQSVASEKAKLQDANTRYRQGRIDIDRLIQNENELSAAELSLALQKVEFERRLHRLALLRSKIWAAVKLPAEDSISTGSQP